MNRNIPRLLGALTLASTLVALAFAGPVAGTAANLHFAVDNLSPSVVSQGALGAFYITASNPEPNTSNISFARLEAEAILLLLSEQGICASAGAACASGSLEPSHVLRAMKIENKIAHGAVRFSLSRYTSDAEIDRALHVLPGVIARLRAVLPVG